LRSRADFQALLARLKPVGDGEATHRAPASTPR
jgi:hypothetical protein